MNSTPLLALRGHRGSSAQSHSLLHAMTCRLASDPHRDPTGRRELASLRTERPPVARGSPSLWSTNTIEIRGVGFGDLQRHALAHRPNTRSSSARRPTASSAAARGPVRSIRRGTRAGASVARAAHTRASARRRCRVHERRSLPGHRDNDGRRSQPLHVSLSCLRVARSTIDCVQKADRVRPSAAFGGAPTTGYHPTWRPGHRQPHPLRRPCGCLTAAGRNARCSLCDDDDA